jgi:hypothetical protein
MGCPPEMTEFWDVKRKFRRRGEGGEKEKRGKVKISSSSSSPVLPFCF